MIDAPKHETDICEIPIKHRDPVQPTRQSVALAQRLRISGTRRLANYARHHRRKSASRHNGFHRRRNKA